MNAAANDQGRSCWPVLAIVTAVLTLAVLTLSLQLWRHDLSVPFMYWGDTLYIAALIKGMMLNGWTHVVPQLGAPFGLEAVAFPIQSTTDWAQIWLIIRFVDTPGVALNLFWLYSIVLTALSALVALRLLGAGRAIAVMAAVLYALLPYTFLRNTAHINLVYYTVPLLAAFCISVLNPTNRAGQSRALFRWGLVAAVLQGFNYIYFTFFAAGLLLLCTLWAAFLLRNWLAARRGVIVLAVLLVSAAGNLAPSLVSWRENGKPPGMSYKTPAESELFGLKLRQLLLPHADNAVPGVGTWARMDVKAKFRDFPNFARLGHFAALGVLASFALLCVSAMGYAGNIHASAKAASVLLLFTFLVSTIGGLGTIFNVLVAPDIRCYDRFSVFIAFFACVVLTLLLTQLGDHLRGTPRGAMMAAGCVALVALSLYDQTLDAPWVTSRYSAEEAEVRDERMVVASLEAALKPGATVMQLPITGFPFDEGRLQMLTYDHARAFLWATDLKWSWPGFSNRHAAWEQELQALPYPEWADRLALSGFDAVWIDRNGLADRGAALEAGLRAAGAAQITSTGSNRYGLLDLSPVRARLLTELGAVGYERAAARTLLSVSLDYGAGFYPPEVDQAGQHFQWMQHEAELSVSNYSPESADLTLLFRLLSREPGEVLVTLDGREVGHFPSSRPASPGKLAFTMTPNSTSKLRFVSQHAPVIAPNDPRNLYTMLWTQLQIDNTSGSAGFK